MLDGSVREGYHDTLAQHAAVEPNGRNFVSVSLVRNRSERLPRTGRPGSRTWWLVVSHLSLVCEPLPRRANDQSIVAATGSAGHNYEDTRHSAVPQPSYWYRNGLTVVLCSHHPERLQLTLPQRIF